MTLARLTDRQLQELHGLLKRFLKLVRVEMGRRVAKELRGMDDAQLG